MTEHRERLRSLPSVNEVLNHAAVDALSRQHGHELVTAAVRSVIDRARAAILDGAESPDAEPPGEDAIVAGVLELAASIFGRSLKPIINATGVVLHTNLGRAPLGEAVLEEVTAVARGYCNLEFDLELARRGHRNNHVAELLRFLTSAEEAVVVNNNAAGIVLALGTLAAGREVIISRGELIEIGGSFRIADIIKASGAVMVEVGTTNRTRPADYEAAIGPQTALIFKAHKSNYSISGFTEEASVKQLAELARAHDLPLVYDIGSGLLRRPENLPLGDEPDVRGAIGDGADLVMFSVDKLLGGPQGGIVAGRAELVGRLTRAPLMRAMRVGKLTLAAIGAACRHHLDDASLAAASPTFAMLERSLDEKNRLASQLLASLRAAGVEARLVESTGQCGGGTLPALQLPSVAVEILPDEGKLGGKLEGKATFAEQVFHRLLATDRPVLGILREGKLLLDILAILPEEVDPIARAVSAAIGRELLP